MPRRNAMHCRQSFLSGQTSAGRAFVSLFFFLIFLNRSDLRVARSANVTL